MLKDHMPKEPTYTGPVASLESINHQLLVADSNLDRFESLIATFESLDDLVDDIEGLVESGDGNATTALMIRDRLSAIEDSTGMRAEIPSLESHEGDYLEYHRISLEAVTGFWNRFKQVLVSDFQTSIDGWLTLFGGYRKFGIRQQARIHTLRQEWADKKRELAETKHKSSLAGQTVFMAFTVDGRLSKKPVADLDTDYKYAHYLAVDYPKALGAYFEKVKGILVSGKFDSDDGFKSTVVSKLAQLPHPSTLLNLPIVGEGSVLLMNRGLEIKKGRGKKPVASEPEYKKLADLSVQTYVKEFVFTWSNLNTGILEDIYFTTAEVDKLLDHAEAYNKLLVNSIDTFKPMTRGFKNLAAATKGRVEDDALSPVNRKAFRQVIGFVRGLTRYSKTPFRLEMIRLQSVAVATRILASRTIATSK